MANAINDFLANLVKHKETARTDKFDIQITPPQAIAQYAQLSPAQIQQGLSLQCEISELPGRDIQVVEYRLGNFIERIPHQNQYGVASFTFIVMGDMWEKKLFDAWIDYMVPAQTGLVQYALDDSNQPAYEADIILNQYDSVGDLVYSVTLQSAMPISVGPLNQSWDNETVHRLAVGFQFRKWLTSGTTTNTTSLNTVATGGKTSSQAAPISTAPSAPANEWDDNAPIEDSTPSNEWDDNAPIEGGTTVK